MTRWGRGWVVKGAAFLRPQDLSLGSSLPTSKEGVLSQHDLLTRLMVWAAVWGKSQTRILSLGSQAF